jgi:hypothetical protein
MMGELLNFFAGVAVGALFSPFWMAIGKTLWGWLKGKFGDRPAA